MGIYHVKLGIYHVKLDIYHVKLGIYHVKQRLLWTDTDQNGIWVLYIPLRLLTSVKLRQVHLAMIQPPVQWVPRLFPGVKRLGYGVDQPPNLAAGLEKGYSYTNPLPPALGQHGMVHVELYSLVREMARKIRHVRFCAYLLKTNNV